MLTLTELKLLREALNLSFGHQDTFTRAECEQIVNRVFQELLQPTTLNEG